MTIGSDTSDIHMINIALTAADGSGRVWQDPTQMIPLGMNGNPEAFVAAIKDSLPLVNNLRVMFNEYSFNPDGSMNPQFERFLAAATAAGYQLTICYGGGDNQRIGLGDADHPSLSNTDAYAALVDNHAVVQGAWDHMMDWMDGHSAVKDGVYGWELMNEAAAYRNTVRANGSDATLSTESFVSLYAHHCAELAQAIEARATGHVLVGGWGYNGDFLTLASTTVDGVSALDYLRSAVGQSLVWSAHFYASWMGTDTATDPASLLARLQEIYAPLTGDSTIVTETNVFGEVDDPSQAMDYHDLFAANLEFFANNGIGIGWFPGLQTGGSHLLYVETDGSVTVRHQHSFAHAFDGFSLGSHDAAHSGDERIVTVLTDAALRNEDYEIAQGQGLYDVATKFGTGFGFDGNDTLTGTLQSNDFLYGGNGNDVMKAAGGDDFLFGQGDNDYLKGGSGFDVLFGGAGNDRLDAGSGSNLLAGGSGDDTYWVRTLRDIVKEFTGDGVDTVKTIMHNLSLTSGNDLQYTSVENLKFIGQGNFNGTGNALNNALTGGGGNDTLSGLAGDDTLTGGAGADLLTGGIGADTFVFATGSGRDVVVDFSDDEDTLNLHGLGGVPNRDAAMLHAVQAGADVVFDFGAGDVLVVQGTTLAAVQNDLSFA